VTASAAASQERERSTASSMSARPWPQLRMKNFAREVVDLSTDGDEELLTVSHLTGVTPRAEKSVTMFLAESFEGYKRVEPGDLVVNTMWAWMGAFGVARQPGIVSPAYGVYRLDSSKVDPRFVEATLRTPQMIAELTSRSTGVWTSRLRLYADELLDTRLGVPALDVQHAIADYIDTEAARAEGTFVRRLDVRRLVAEREEAVVRILIMSAPGSYRPISALANYVNGFPFKPDDFTPSGLPVIRIRQLVDPEAEQDLFDGWVPDRVRLSDGDLVFSWSASLEVRIWGRGPAILNQHLFRVLPAPGIELDWLRWVLHVVRSDFGELMHGSTMTHITKPMMRELRVPVPDLGTQRDIAAKANLIHERSAELLSALDEQAALLTERRQALITAAVTGQLEIPGVAA